MAVIKESQFDLDTQASYLARMVFDESDGDCFYCYRTLYDTTQYGDARQGEDPWRFVENIVYWRGNAESKMIYILLHAECATRLGSHLIKDGMIAQERISKENRQNEMARAFWEHRKVIAKSEEAG